MSSKRPLHHVHFLATPLTDFFKNNFTESHRFRIYTFDDVYYPFAYQKDWNLLIQFVFLQPGFKKLGLGRDYFPFEGEDRVAISLVGEAIHLNDYLPQDHKAVITDYHKRYPEYPYYAGAVFYAQIQRIKDADIVNVLKTFTSASPLKTSYLADSISAADPRATAELRQYISQESNQKLIPLFCKDITFTGTLIKGQKSTINAIYKGTTTQIVVEMPIPTTPIKPASDISGQTMADIFKKFTTANPLKIKALR